MTDAGIGLRHLARTRPEPPRRLPPTAHFPSNLNSYRTRQRNHLASPPTLVNVALVSSTLASRSIQSWIYPVSIRTNFGDLKQTQLLF